MLLFVICKQIAFAGKAGIWSGMTGLTWSLSGRSSVGGGFHTATTSTAQGINPPARVDSGPPPAYFRSVITRHGWV